MNAAYPRPSFLFGLALPFRALGLVAGDFRVLGLALLPFLVAVGVTVGLGTWLDGLLMGQARALFGLSETGFLAGLVGWIAGIFASIAATLLMPFVITLVAVPFNDFLAEAAETRADPPLAAVPGPDMKQRLELIGMDLVKTLVAVGVMIPMLLLALVPVVQFLAFPVLWMLFTFQMLSYPQTRRGENFSAGVAFVRSYAGASLGFGFMCSVLAAVPFVSYLVPPLAVVGGTLLYARARGAGDRNLA